MWFLEKTLYGVLWIATGAIGAGAAQSGSLPAQPISPSASQTAASSVTQARRLTEQGKFDEAIAELQQLSEKNPDMKGLSRELGIAFYKKGDYPKAIQFLKTATLENAQDDEAEQLLGLSYYLSDRARDAIPYLERVQNWFPRANVDAAYILGICYIQSKDYPQARKAFAKMFDVAPD